VVNSAGAPVLIAGSRVPLLGPNGPLPSTALVTLAASTLLAQGIGVPTAVGGTGAPLPDEVVLDPSEIAIIQDHVTANNQAIREICGAANIPVLDVNGLLTELATTGRKIGGINLSGAFLSGGVFSYDGVHPNDVGYAIVANEFIRVINANGGALPLVDLGAVLGIAGAATGDVRAGALRPSEGAWIPFEFSAEAYAEMLEAFPRLDDRP
jgi:hypothetical protein